MDIRGSFPGVKQLGCEINHSLISGDEITNEQSYYSTPSICLHGMDKEHFIVSFYSEKCPYNVKALLLDFNV